MLLLYKNSFHLANFIDKFIKKLSFLLVKYLYYFIFIKTSLEDLLVPLGRGAVRGRRQIDEHFRIPRPQSSLGVIGKQGED